MRAPILIAATGLVLGLLASPRSAQACQCRGPMEPAAQLEAADAVFEGRVTAIREEGHLVHVTFHVTRRWKGEVGEDITIFTYHRLRCGLNLAVGQHWVVLGRLGEGGARVPLLVNSCWGSVLLTPEDPAGQALIDLAEARLGPGVVPVTLEE